MLAPGPVGPRWLHRLTVAALGVLGLLGTAACGPSEREIAAARARHTAALDGFVVRQEPVAGGRLEQDVELGLAVRRDEEDDSEEAVPLPGVSLDVEQVDATGKGKRHWRVWVDTAGLRPGGAIRRVHVLEDVDYAPGDGFRIEVRQDASATGSGPTS